MCVSIYINKCSMQCVDNGFNKFKVDDLTHVKMLIVQEMWKIPLYHSNIIAKYWVAYEKYIIISAKFYLLIMVLTY